MASIPFNTKLSEGIYHQKGLSLKTKKALIQNNHENYTALSTKERINYEREILLIMTGFATSQKDFDTSILRLCLAPNSKATVDELLAEKFSKKRKIDNVATINAFLRPIMTLRLKEDKIAMLSKLPPAKLLQLARIYVKRDTSAITKDDRVETVYLAIRRHSRIIKLKVALGVSLLLATFAVSVRAL
jgi:hypothetical protein